MKKYIRNIIIILFVIIFISFIVFMLFFKQHSNLNKNNKIQENNTVKVNNTININDKDLLGFKNNFLNCNNSFLNENGTTYNVITNVNDKTKCVVSAVGISDGFVKSTSCFISKSLLNEKYFNDFINDLNIDKMESNISKYKECSFSKNTLPEINKNIEDFKNNFIKCNKALFVDSEKHFNYNVFNDNIDKERCVFIFDVIDNNSKNNKTIVCNIEKKNLSLKLYDLIIDGIKNNKLNNIDNATCSGR